MFKVRNNRSNYISRSGMINGIEKGKPVRQPKPLNAVAKSERIKGLSSSPSRGYFVKLTKNN